MADGQVIRPTREKSELWGEVTGGSEYVGRAAEREIF